MRNINELIGIIKGINFDGVINEKETECLQTWVKKNRNLAYKSHQIKLIKAVDEVLEDNIITEEERVLLLKLAGEFLDNSTEDFGELYELNGIIEGIVADNVVNKLEIIQLQNWMNEHLEFVNRNREEKNLIGNIYEILENECIADEKQEILVNLLSNKIKKSQFETKLEFLCMQVNNRKNIGLDLIDILDNEKAIGLIHKKAERELKMILVSYNGISAGNPELIFVSLSLIAMLEYDGNYYDHVRDIYASLYEKHSEQKIEGMIRSILNRYRTAEERREKNSRVINIALGNAIVPAHFLASFFEFIFDIYKVNFEYDLPENLQEEFQFVYSGIKSDLQTEGDDLQIRVTHKSYKLIQATKKLIVSGRNTEAIIGLSVIVIKLIDKAIWGNDVKIYNPYLKMGYDEWIDRLDVQKSTLGDRRHTGSYLRWKPEYILDGTSIYLLPPTHRIKADYDYRNVRIVISRGSEQIYENACPDIREIIGGYQIIQQRIPLENPLGEITYRLMAGNEVIYDSKDVLYRKSIVFADNGKEISNNTNYSGSIIICHKHLIRSFELIYNAGTYILSSGNVAYDDAVLIEDTVFQFSAVSKPGIIGTKYEGQYLKHDESGDLLPVYSAIDFLAFETTVQDASYIISINQSLYRLSDLTYKQTQRGNKYKITAELPILEPGIYKVVADEVKSGKKRQLITAEFGFDPDFEYEVSKLDASHYKLKIFTGLLRAPVYTEIDTYAFEEDWLKVTGARGRYSYLAAIPLDIYRIDDRQWTPFSESIWIGDIRRDSVLRMYGTHAESMLIYSDKGKLLTGSDDLLLRRNGACVEISIGFLASYKSEYDYVLLVFLKDGHKQKAIFCYNRCVLDENKMEMQFDPVENVLHVTPAFYGIGKIYFEVVDQNNELIFKSDYAANGVDVEICGIHSFEDYKITFYEKSSGLSLQKNRLLSEHTARFYARRDFVGRSFKINEVYFDQMICGKFMRKSHYFNRVYVYFKKQIDKDTFTGEVYARTGNGAFMLDELNPVEIEICSEEINDTMELSITKDGDGLFLDFDHHGIKNTLYDDKGVDIFSYIIAINGEISA